MAIPEISPYLPPYLNKVTNPAIPQPTLPMLGVRKKVDQVKGYEGAMAYADIGPDSQTIVIDADNPIVWFIATDSNGNKATVQGYSIMPYTPPKPVTLDDLMAEMREMKERLMKVEEGNDNGKSDFRSAGKVQSNGTNLQTGNRNGQSGPVGKPAGNAESK